MAALFTTIDFETNDTSQFTSTSVDAGMDLSAGAGYKKFGSYGARVLYDGANDRACGIKTFAATNEAYTGMWVYISSGVTISQWQYINLLIAMKDEWTSNAYIGVYRQNAALDRWRVIGYGTDEVLSATNFSLDAWHWVEIHYLTSAVNGGTEVWVDGDSIASDLTNDTSAQQTARIEAGSLYTAGTPPDDSYIYMDHIKGDTAYMGVPTEASGTTTMAKMMHYARLRRN